MVNLNRCSKHPAAPEPAALDGPALRSLLRAGVTVLDSRRPEHFDAGHLAGAINLPVSSAGVGTRAGWALEPQERIVIVAQDDADAREMASALQAVGFWELAGSTIAGRASWQASGLPVAAAGSWDLDQLVLGLREDAVALVDVREPREWATGHIRGSHQVPLHRLRDVSAVPPPADARTTAVACAADVRAAFAASLLRRAGRHDVVRVSGGGVPDLGALGIELELGLD